MSYSAYSVNRLQNQILRLNQRVRNLKKIISQLDYSFEARLFEAIEAVAMEYGSLLRPHPISIEVKIGDDRNEYEISTAQIVCIVADELTKGIVLTKPITPKGSSKRKKQVVDFEGQWEVLESKLPASRILLCKVNKSTYVNVAFYELDKGILQCRPDLAKDWNPSKTLKLNAAYAQRFKATKEGFRQLSSIEKRAVHFFSKA